MHHNKAQMKRHESAKSLADFQGLANINVKAETIQGRAKSRLPLKKRPCIVPADGFYKWKKIDPKTRPYFYSLNLAIRAIARTEPYTGQ